MRPNSHHSYSFDGHTPLQAAVLRGHVKLAQESLRLGADPNLPCKHQGDEGATALDLAGNLDWPADGRPAQQVRKELHRLLKRYGARAGRARR